jgi:hypothetical protein
MLSRDILAIMTVDAPDEHNQRPMKKVLNKIWQLWKRFAHGLGRVNTVILLTLFYFLVISPFGLLLRLFGWSPLESGRRFHNRETNWKPFEHPVDRQSLRRQS